MTTKKDKSSASQRLLLCSKGKNSSSYSNEDSGYSSDSSAASVSSWRLKQEVASGVKENVNFLTPDVNWKMKLRCSSTPQTSVKSKEKAVESPDLGVIEGPLLRSQTYPLTSPSLSSFALNLSLNTPSDDTTATKRKEKSCFLLRSPLKSPFKLIKKQKSAEDVSDASIEHVFSNPEVKQRTVKALFCTKSDSPVSTPVRRSSPRLSNILTRLMESASYILPNVFRFLSPKDLLRASHVCQQLRRIIQESSRLNSKRKLFLETSKTEFDRLGKENVNVKSVVPASASALTVSSPRKHFQQIQNCCPPSPQKISSPKPTSRFERFVKEGKKLLPGETQQKCVQCANPAHISATEAATARCTNPACAFVYCTRCLFPSPHRTPSDCIALKPKPKVSSASKMLSKACKKRLRRL